MNSKSCEGYRFIALLWFRKRNIPPAFHIYVLQMIANLIWEMNAKHLCLSVSASKFACDWTHCCSLVETWPTLTLSFSKERTRVICSPQNMIKILYCCTEMTENKQKKNNQGLNDSTSDSRSCGTSALTHHSQHLRLHSPLNHPYCAHHIGPSVLGTGRSVLLGPYIWNHTHAQEGMHNVDMTYNQTAVTCAAWNPCFAIWYICECLKVVSKQKHSK